MEKPNIVIIGGGPGGASTAIYLARHMHPVTLIDAAEEIHGRTAMAMSLENYLTHVGPVTGVDMLKRIDTQLKRFGVEQVNAKVTRVSKNDGKFIVEMGEQKITADYLVIAVGVADIMPKLDGMDPYYDNAIFHCQTCDWYQNRDKKAILVTDDNSGLLNALGIMYKHRPPLLTVIPNTQQYDYNPQLVAMLEQVGAKVVNSPIKEIKGDGKYLTSAKLADGSEIDTEIMFTNLGHKPIDDFLKAGGIEVERDDHGFILVDFSRHTLESSEENLYAVGPCNQGPDQAVIAAGQGAMAADAINNKILRRAYNL